MPSTIFEVCERMQAEGYEWGSMTYPDAFSSMTLRPHDLSSALLKPMDPTKTLYFSRVMPTYVDDDSEEEGVSLDWHSWLVGEDYMLEEYSMRPLLFAKFETPRLASASDDRFVKGGAWHRTNTNWLPTPDWQKVADNYAGIRVNGNSDIFPTWDVDTVCIWDPEVVISVCWFPNAGEPWMYE